MVNDYAGELSLNGSELLDGESSINLSLIILPSVCNVLVLLTLSVIYLEHISNKANKTSTRFSELYPFLGYQQQLATLHQTPTVHDTHQPSQSLVVAKP
jgi:hypothetical protein